VTRIIAGLAGGRRIAVPPGRRTRPTSDRAREGLFASVTAALGTLEGAAVLDAYAGSGAVGLEALSRGAGDVLLIESDPKASAVIRRNTTDLGLPGGTLISDRVDRVLARGPGQHARRHLVFADPPYAASGAEVTRMLELLAAQGWLVPGALVVIERASRDRPPDWPPGYQPGPSRRYGEATLWYGRAAGDAPVSQPRRGERETA
jgi:16S rRNA (guanine966-N2)-methyltransferase